ncbi:SpoIIE family protein phosphatase [Streptomyces thermolineatus]|uniref:SpoIIE family protein phosphatase n=1 Tax=Streptomyces thermolineatus TaxID=44033 RepID=UPI0031D0C14A
MLCTDGLVETSGLDLDRGTAELAGRIERSGDRPAEELADLLAGSALRSAVRSDDIALLILRPGA